MDRSDALSYFSGNLCGARVMAVSERRGPGGYCRLAIRDAVDLIEIVFSTAGGLGLFAALIAPAQTSIAGCRRSWSFLIDFSVFKGLGRSLS